jgi:outer membrane protein, multidrug efflux system
VGWVSDFGNPKLNELAREAAGNNFSLESALQRVFQAEERACLARAEQFPRVNATVDSARRKLAGRVIQNPRQGFGFFGGGFNTQHNFSIDTVWEVDLWGRLGDLKKSELAKVDAQFQAYQAARLSLVAATLKAAFELVESQEQIKSLQKNQKSLQTNLEILDAKLEGGAADQRTALEIALSRADIARSKSALIAETQDSDQARRTLETLLGRYPKGIIESLDHLPDPVRAVPVGLPSDLLVRRPDILQAEMQVNGALFTVSAAQKQLLPSFRLTSGIGTNTTDVFKDLFDWNNLVWNIAQGVTQPVFQAGRLKAQIRLSEHQRDELIANYANTALTAFREVEVALAAEQYLNEQVLALKINVKEAKLAEELSLSDYEKGLIEIITLLESQRRAFDAESSLLAIRLQRLLNRIDLYLALGGDFDSVPKTLCDLKDLKTPPHGPTDALPGHPGACPNSTDG